KDLAMASVRSLGWTSGTVRELGGSLLDVAKIPMAIRRANALEKDVQPARYSQGGKLLRPPPGMRLAQAGSPANPTYFYVHERIAPPAFTNRMAYAVTLPAVIGLYGALYQKIATGEGPSELRDYFFPKNGKIGPDGSPERITFPSYVNDVVAW